MISLPRLSVVVDPQSSSRTTSTMSAPSSPIDDGTPMNVSHSPHPRNAAAPTPDANNGQPPAQCNSRSPSQGVVVVENDSNPEQSHPNDHQPQSSPPLRPGHSLSTPSDSPPSPMQHDAVAAASENDIDGNLCGAGAAAAADDTPQVGSLGM